MAYSESLAERIRHCLRFRRGIVEKKMFGGAVFLLRGNICVGVWESSLIVRLGPEAGTAALTEPYVGPFDVTGKPMRGWVMVAAEGLEDESSLSNWVERSLEFVGTLPSK